ncbi:MAG: tyrosine-type recombinase/integrase [Methylophilaceae bacterium]
MAVVKLMANTLHTLKCPQGKRRIEYCDSEEPGLYLLVSDKGQRTFFWRTKVDGKTTHHKIGRISDITLVDARAEVKRLKEEQALSAGQGNLSVDAINKASMTMNAFWEKEYYPFAQSTVPRSVKRLEQLWRLRIQPRFGHVKLRDMNSREIQSFLMDLRNKEKMSPATCDYHGALLKRLSTCSVRWEYLEVGFARNIQLFHEQNGVENILTDQQLRNLLEVLHTDSNRRVCQIALLLLSTGARLSEALKAKWSDIDVKRKLWIVPAENSKSKRTRSIPLSDSALDVLKQVERQNSDQYVFTNHKTGKPYINIFRPWDRIRRKVGLGFLRCHDLRHNFASYCVNNGRSLYEVSKLLGHADTRTTIRYSHLNEKTLLEASNSVSSKISDVMQMEPTAVPTVETVDS